MLLAGVAGHSACAQGAAGAMMDRVEITLRGRISPKCSLSDMAGRLDFDAAQLGRDAESAAVGFTIDCNTPFIYQVNAAAGAMRLAASRGAKDGAGPYLPYRIKLTIPTNDGGTLRADCGSETLSAGGAAAHGCVADSGHAVAINQQGEMLVSLPASSEQPMAGRYGDNLEITLSVKQ